MVETQTHSFPLETTPPQPSLETEASSVEPFSDETLESWRGTLMKTGAYLNDFPNHENRILKARSDNAHYEMVKLRSEFVTTVESPILAFARAYAASVDDPTFDGAIKSIVRVLPRVPTRSQNKLLLTGMERATTIMRIENYCRQHEINCSVATDPSEIAQGVDMYINGKTVCVQRSNKRATHPPSSAASVHADNIQRKGSLLNPASDAYMTPLLHRVSTAPTKQIIQPAKPPTKKVAKNVPAPKSKPTNTPSKEKSTTDKTLRIAPIIATKAIGLSLNENEPPYARREDMLTTTPEALVTQILDDALDDDETVDFYKIDSAEFGRRVAASIMRHHDSDLVVALKQYTAQTHGVRLVAEVNGIAKELVAAADGKLSQAGLRDALTYLYEFGHKTEATQSLQIDNILGQINGRRVEVSSQRLLETMGYRVQEADRQQDDRGVDIFIDGVPFDIKSNAQTAQNSATKEVTRSQKIAYFPSVRLVPPFTRESFEGQVIVPDHVIAELAKDESLKAKIDKAIENYRAQFGGRITYDEASPNLNKTYRPKHLDTI